MAAEPIGLDKHDAAGMARWLRERSTAAHDFLALDGEAQQRQYLNRWQQNVLPHLAFRFKQAAEMIERLERALTETHDAWTAETTKRLQAEHERDCAVEDLVRLQAAYAARMAMIAEPVEAPASHHCETCQCPEIEAATDSVSTRPCSGQET